MVVFGVWSSPFDQWDGIDRVISGYSGGHIENPTYKDVKSGTSGHYEVVQITFDPSIFSYENYLKFTGSKLIRPMKVVNFMIVEIPIGRRYFIIPKNRRN